MFRRTKVRYFLFIFLIFVLSFVFYLRFKNSSKLSNSQVEKKTLSILQKCKITSRDTLASFDATCAYSEFGDLVDKNSIERIMGVLEETFSQTESGLEFGTTSCHAPAHIVGEIAYEKGMSFSDLLDSCSTRCGFGCLHGGFMGKVAEEGRGFLDNLQHSCDDLGDVTEEEVRSCWHVVGHGLGEYFGEDLEKAVDACLRLSDTEEKWHCISGVRMEFLLGASYNPERQAMDFTTENFISFCRRFPPEYQDDCFGEAAYYSYRITGEEELSIDICSQLPYSEYTSKLHCAYGGGSIMVSVNKNEPERVYEYCQRYINKDLVRECVIGAVGFFSSEWEYMENGARLCEISPIDVRNECFSYYGESVARWYGDERRKEVCKKLDSLDEKYCLSDPTNPRNYLNPPDSLN